MMLPEWRLEQYVWHLKVAEEKAQHIWGNIVPDPIYSTIDVDSVYKFSQLLPPRLFLRPQKQSPKVWERKLWVFWSNDEEEEWIQNSSLGRMLPKRKLLEERRIKNALCHYSYRDGILIQFWAPITTDGGRCILTTMDKPFAISSPHRGLCSYRNALVSYKFAVEEEADSNLAEDQLLFGLPGRVFRHKWPESTPDVSYYSAKEYPQRDFALSCGIKGSFAWPILEPTGDQHCVGVLEIIVTSEHVEYSEVHRVITEVASLESPFAFSFRNIQVSFEPADEEILKVLTEMRKTPQLALAQAWVPHKYSTTTMEKDSILDLNHDDSNLSCPKEVMVTINSKVNIPLIQPGGFSGACNKYPLRKGEGLVGRSLVSHKPCYCRDITQLSMTEYSLSHCARKWGLTGCFTICLQSICTRDVDYVLEFFLHPADSKDPQNVLGTLLATMKQFFQSFKVASGEELGEELLVKVYKSSLKDEPDSFKICQTTRSPPRLEGSENDGEVVQLDSPDQQLIVEDAIQHEKNIFGAGIGDVTIPLEETCIMKTSKSVHQATKSGISYEDLKEHFGRPLNDVAESLNVSRSTFKRLCRKHGIFRWKNCRRKKVNGLPSDSNISYCNKFSGFGEEQIPECSMRELSFSDLPPMRGTAAFAHTIPQISSAQNANNITVKATYNGVLIKFQLSFSSNLAELEEKVRMRLKLKDGTFSIKYQDDESEWVLIACDEDLQDCMDCSKSLNKTTIRMMVDLPITNQAP